MPEHAVQELTLVELAGWTTFDQGEFESLFVYGFAASVSGV